MKSSAIFSDDRTYRYVLTRWWGDGDIIYDKCVLFIGLNPSTADETKNDPTITREIGFAKTWGFRGLVKVNLFGYRATDPKEMKKQEDPVGPKNDEWILDVHNSTALTVATWGGHGDFLDRSGHVMGFLFNDVYCLGVTKNNQPKHTLYLPASTPLSLYRRGFGLM